MKTIKEQIKEELKKIKEDYNYNFKGTKTASFTVTTQDGYRCELSVDVIRGARVLLLPKFGYLEIEGDVQKEHSSERDLQLIANFNAKVWGFKDGLRLATEEIMGIKNPEYVKNSLNMFNVNNTEYKNETEIYKKVEDMFDAVYKFEHAEEYTERRFMDYALREYVLKDMEVSFCKELKLVIPIDYRKKAQH